MEPNLPATNAPITFSPSTPIPSTLNNPISASPKRKFSKALLTFLLAMFFCLSISIIFIVSPAFRNFIYHKSTIGVRFYKVAENTPSKTNANRLSTKETIDFQCQDETFLLNFKISSKIKQISSSFGNWKDICVKNKYMDENSYWLPQNLVQVSGLFNKPVISGLSIPSKKQLEKFYVDNFWTTYPNIVGLPTGDGRFFNISGNPGGGINLLPDKYQEKRKNVAIEMTSLDGKKQTFNLFNNVLEFTTVKAITDYNNKRIWLILVPSSYSCYAVTNKTNPDCQITFSYLDLATQKVITAYSLPYENPNRVYPLAVSPKGELAVTISRPGVVPYIEKLLLFDPTTNKATITNTDFQVGINYGMGRSYETDQVARYDREENLYIIARQTNNSAQIYKLQPDGTSSWITLDFKKNFEADMQLTIDAGNHLLYAVNVTWDGNNSSVLNVYDFLNKNLLESNQITQGTEDVRGIDANNGYFLAGYAKGLGIYSQNDKTWKFVKKNDGLMEDNVRDIKVMGGNTVCVTHEDKGSSCFSGDIGLYYSLLSETQIAGNKLNPTPTPAPFKITYTPISDPKNWKSYTDNNGVYSLSYPTNLNLITKALDNGAGQKSTAVFLTDLKSFDEMTNAYTKNPTIIHPRLNLTFDPSSNEPSESGLTFTGENSLYSKSSKFTINGYLGVINNSSVNNNNYQNIYIKNPSGGVLYFQTSNISTDTINKIISSLKLTKRYVSPTPTPTLSPSNVDLNNGLTKYNNGQYSYSFIYPKTGIINQKGISNTVNYRVEDENTSQIALLGNTSDVTGINYLTIQAGNSVTYFDYIASTKVGAWVSGTSYVRQNDTSVDGVTAYLLTYAESGSHEQQIILKKNGVIYELSGQYHDPGPDAPLSYPNDLTVYNNVLSSFKFTK